MAEGDVQRSASARRLVDAINRSSERAQAGTTDTEAKTSKALRERDQLLRRERDAVEEEYKAVEEEVAALRKRAAAADGRAKAARTRGRNLRETTTISDPAERSRKVAGADRAAANADSKASSTRAEVIAARQRQEDLAARRSQIRLERASLREAIASASVAESWAGEVEKNEQQAATAEKRTDAAVKRVAKAKARKPAALAPPKPPAPPRRPSIPRAPAGGGPTGLTQAYIDAQQRADAIKYARRPAYRYDNPETVRRQRDRLIQEFSLKSSDLTDKGASAAAEVAKQARAAAQQQESLLQGALPGIGQSSAPVPRATKPQLGTQAFKNAVEKLKQIPSVQLELYTYYERAMEAGVTGSNAINDHIKAQLESERADAQVARNAASRAQAAAAKAKAKPKVAAPRVQTPVPVAPPEPVVADDLASLERQRAALSKQRKAATTGSRAADRRLASGDANGRSGEAWDKAQERMRATYDKHERDYSRLSTEIGKLDERIAALKKAAQEAAPKPVVAAKAKPALAAPAPPAPPAKPAARVASARPEGAVGFGNQDKYEKIIRDNAELLARTMSEEQRAQFQAAVAPTPPERQQKAVTDLKTAVERNTQEQAKGTRVGRASGTGIVPRTLSNAGVFTRQELDALEKLSGVPSPGPLAGRYPYAPLGQGTRTRVEGEVNIPGGPRSPLQEASARLKAAQDAASESAQELRKYNRDTRKYTQQQGEDLERVHKENIDRVSAIRGERKEIERAAESAIADNRTRAAAENARTESILAAARGQKRVNERALATINTTAQEVSTTRRPSSELVAGPRPFQQIPDWRAVELRRGEQVGPRSWIPNAPYQGRPFDAYGTAEEIPADWTPPPPRTYTGAAGAGGAGGGGRRPPSHPLGADPDEWGDELKRMKADDADLASAFAASEDGMRRWNSQVGISDQAMRKHGTFTTEFIEAARKGDVAYREWGWQIGAAAAKFGAWTAAGAGIYAAIGAVQKVGQGAVDSASAIPSIERTIPDLDAGQAQKQLRQLSTDFAVPISTSADAVMRMGAVYRDQAEAVKAAHTALLAYRTGEVDVGTATTQLTAIATGMGVSAGGLADIFDRLNYVQNNYGVRIPDLLTGTSRLSAAWRQAGGDADHLVAIITALNRTAGVSGAQSATILGRMIGNVNRPSSKATLEQYGIPTDASDIQGTLTKAIEVAQSPLTKPGDIQSIAKALAGGTQYQRQFVALLQDPKIYNKLLGEEQAGKYKNSGAKELEKVMQTFSMRIAQIGTQLGNLGSNLAQSGFLTTLGAGVTLLTVMLKTVNGVLEVFNSLPGPLKTVLATGLTLLAAMQLMRRLGIGGALQGRFGGVGDRVAPFLQESPGRTARRNVTKGLNDAVKEYGNDFERTTRAARGANVTANNAQRRARAEVTDIKGRMNLPQSDPAYMKPADGFREMAASNARARRANDRLIDAEVAQENASERLTSARKDLASFEKEQASVPRRERNNAALRFAQRLGLYGPASLPRDQPSPEQVRKYGRMTKDGLPTFVVDPGIGRESGGEGSSGVRINRNARTYRLAGDAANMFASKAKDAADATQDAATQAEAAGAAFRKTTRTAQFTDGSMRYTDNGPSSLRNGRFRVVPGTGNFDPSLLGATRVQAAGEGRSRSFGTGFIGRQRQRFSDFADNFDASRVSGAPGQYQGRTIRYSPRERISASASTIGLRARLTGQRVRDFDTSSITQGLQSSATRARAQIGSSLGKVKTSLKGIGTSITSLVDPAELLLAGILSLPAIFIAVKSALDNYNKEADDVNRTPTDIDDKKKLLGQLDDRANKGTTKTERLSQFSDDLFKSNNPLTVLPKAIGGLFGAGDNDYTKMRQDAAKARLDAYRKLQDAQAKARAEGRDVPELTGDEIDKDLSVIVNRYQAGRATLDDAIAATQKALREVDKTSKLTADEKTDKKESLLNDLAQLNQTKQDKIQEEIDAQNSALEALVNSGAATASQLNGFIAKQVGLINQFRGDTTAEGMQKYAAARQSLISTLKNAGSGDSLDAALTNAMGDPDKIAAAYREADKQFSSAYRTAKGASSRTPDVATAAGGLLAGGFSGLMHGGTTSSTRVTGGETDPELAAELKAIKLQRRQAAFEYTRAITEARNEVASGNANAGLPRAALQLRQISKFVQAAIKVYGRNSKEVLALIAQQQAAEATVVQEQAALITAKSDYAAAGESTDAGAAQQNISGLQELLAFQQKHPQQYSEADILGTKTAIRSAQKALADQVRQQAEDLLNARYELLESQTDDPVKQAMLEAQRTAAIVKRGGFSNAADKMRAQAAANNAQREAQNQAVQAKIDDIDFDVSIGKMTQDQQIAAYEKLLKTAKMGSQMKKQLQQQIAKLKYDAENADESSFNLGLDNIKIPTMYEVARLVKGGPASVTQGVTNANTVNVTINGEADYEQLGKVLEKHIKGTGKSIGRAAQVR